MVVFEDEVRQASSETYMMTDDGSYGEQGLVTKKLDELIAAGRKIDFVLAVGPVPMMRAVAAITAPLGIKTMVSLNSIMVDGTGMCGGCRVLLGNQSKFACVDGPEFDASQVNFEVLMQRNTMYREKECAVAQAISRRTRKRKWPSFARSLRQGRRTMSEKNTLPLKDRMKILRTPHAGARPAGAQPQLRGSESGPACRRRAHRGLALH